MIVHVQLCMVEGKILNKDDEAVIRTEFLVGLAGHTPK